MKLPPMWNFPHDFKYKPMMTHYQNVLSGKMQ